MDQYEDKSKDMDKPDDRSSVGDGIDIKIDSEIYTFKNSALFGKSLLEKAGKEPVDNYLLYQVQPDGMMAQVRLDETVMIRGASNEQFFSAEKGKFFKFKLDQRLIEDWPVKYISGRKLKDLAQVDPNEFGIWLEVDGQDDRPIQNLEIVSLAGGHEESFYSGIKETTPGNNSFKLPSKDVSYLSKKNTEFDTVEDVNSNSKGILFKNLSLPPNQFDFQETNVLIILPAGYPDCPPDMFYTHPWLKLSKTGHYANCADQAHPFKDVSWQRWSRHNPKWRPGVDGIWTVLQRVKNALKEANE